MNRNWIDQFNNELNHLVIQTESNNSQTWVETVNQDLSIPNPKFQTFPIPNPNQFERLDSRLHSKQASNEPSKQKHQQQEQQKRKIQASIINQDLFQPIRRRSTRCNSRR